MILVGVRSCSFVALEKAYLQVMCLNCCASIAFYSSSKTLVVLEAPIGQTSDVWSLVQAILAKKTRVSSHSFEHVHARGHVSGPQE